MGGSAGAAVVEPGVQPPSRTADLGGAGCRAGCFVEHMRAFSRHYLPFCRQRRAQCSQFNLQISSFASHSVFLYCNTLFTYAYILGYGSKGAVSSADASSLLSRTALVPHTDDSEVTLNVSLGREFQGGVLRLKGLRSGAGEGQVQADIVPSAGRAVLHLGQHLHEVTAVTAGERFALIMWMRSHAFRAATCPCCMTFRRQRCICAPSWN
jgi:hypothetical protein